MAGGAGEYDHPRQLPHLPGRRQLAHGSADLLSLGPLWVPLLRFVLQVFIWPMADTPARGWIAPAATAFFVLMYFAILFKDGRSWTKKHRAGLRGNRLF